jgi:hypothetical protein
MNLPHAGPVVIYETGQDDPLPPQTYTVVLFLLTFGLWILAILLGYRALHLPEITERISWQKRFVPLEIASNTPQLDAAPVMPDMARVMPSAGDFVVDASVALARDEAESALLRLRLLQDAGHIVIGVLR